MKNTHPSLTHRTDPSSVPEGHRKLERFKNWRGRVAARWMARSERHAKGGAGGHTQSEALSRGVSQGARRAPSTGHRTALAWLGALLLAMSLGLGHAVAVTPAIKLYVKNGTAQPVLFTFNLGECVGLITHDPTALNFIAPGAQTHVTIDASTGRDCDTTTGGGISVYGAFSITPSTSTEAQQFLFYSADLVGDNPVAYIYATYHANTFAGELSLQQPDGSYIWTLKPLEARLSGPVDARLTKPRNFIAYDSGQWGLVAGANPTSKIDTLKFAAQGWTGAWFQTCEGHELFHAQHVKRLPNKNGRAYFMVSQSRGHAGYIYLMETNPGVPGVSEPVLDPVTDLIRPSTDGTAIGKIIWQEYFSGKYGGNYNPIGNWNHPGQLSLNGGVLLVNVQNWSEGGCFVAHCTGNTSNPYLLGTDEDAVLFYDVRDPANPKYWGKMTATELGLPERDFDNGCNGNGSGGDRREMDVSSLVRVVPIDGSPAKDEWTLVVGRYKSSKYIYTTWKTSAISPNIKDWTRVVGDGTLNPQIEASGQHGDDFNSYEWGSFKSPTPARGVERNLIFEVENNSAGGGENDGFTFRGGAGISKADYEMGLPFFDRDWDSESLYVTTKGVPVAYSMATAAGPDGGTSSNDPILLQVSDTRNAAANQTPHPVSSVVTTLWDSGPGSLRQAIGYGGTITFAPELSGRTINLTSGPLVVSPYDATINASALPNGITTKTRDGSPTFIVQNGNTVTTSGLAFPTLTTGDIGSWFGQTTNAYSGGSSPDALQSGDIGDSQETTLTTKVTGPGTLTFWWKVSSETSSDFLRFRLDFAQVAAAPEISGEVNWQQKTIAIPAGNRTLEWTYSKNGSVSTGADAGWVDEVVFTPTKPALTIEQPVGTPVRAGTVVGWGYNNYGLTPPPLGLDGVIAVAAGGQHSAALTSSGRVVVWGDGSQGQKGVPPAALSGVTAIAAGAYHTLALKNTGRVVAWGSNSSYQLGVPSDATYGVVAIAAGAEHSVALKDDGTVLAWGGNSYGQTTVPAGLSNVIAIAAGYYHTVALKSNGKVVAWGNNEEGQTTVPAEALSGVVAIAAGGYRTVALKNDKTVKEWGLDVYSQTATGVIAIAAGTYHTVALTDVGTVVAWGDNSYGQTNPSGLTGVTAIGAAGSHTLALVPTARTIAFGNQPLATTSLPKTFTLRNTGTAPLVPVSVTTTTGNNADFVVSTTGMLASVPAGGSTTITVTFNPPAPGLRTTKLRVVYRDTAQTYTDTVDIPLTGTGTGTTAPAITIEDSVGSPLGKVVAWGAGSPGQTGSLHFGQSTVPPGAQAGVVSVAAGGFHSLALQNGGTVVAWGANGSGQASPPVGLTRVTGIFAGGQHSAALDADGRVWAWGAGAPGETGGVNYGQSTVPPEALSGVDEVATGGYHTVALKSDGMVVAWGYNFYGQRDVPPGLSGVVQIAAGAYHTVARKSDGTVVAWGRNGDGQVTGTPTTISPTSAIANPVTLGGQVLSEVYWIAAGDYHTAAIKNGTVVAWGSDAAGQRTPPPGLSGVERVSAGASHTVARRVDGTVVIWGSNTYGQKTLPAVLNGLAAKISAGGVHTLALAEPSSTHFFSHDVGTSQAPKIFTIKNTGTDTLVINGASITGLGNPEDFTVNIGATPISIPVGGQTTLTVTFTPKALGDRTATLSVLSNDPGAGTVNITLTGVGTGVVLPKIALDLPPGTPAGATSVDFGSKILGTPGVPKTFTIRNTGNSPLSITSVTTTGGQSGSFIVNTSQMLNSIPAGSQTTFIVTFNPAILGTRLTNLSVLSNDATNGSIGVGLTGLTTPPNDNFANAQTLAGASGTATGGNTGATREVGEPDLVYGPPTGGTHSVWYRWTAPFSGTATIDTLGSDFDTLLGVYTGSAVGSLTLIASNDDTDVDSTSKVTFAAVNGATYRIAVDGKNGGRGSITLNYSVVARDYLVKIAGGIMTVTNLTDGSDPLAISEPSAGNIQIAVSGRNFSVNDGTNLLGSSGSLSRAGITSIIVNAGESADIINVGAFTGTLPTLTINGGTGDDTVNFNGDITFAANANLDVDLQNDSTTPGVDTVNVAANAHLRASGTGSIAVKASRNVAMAAGSSFETVNGDLILSANAGGSTPGAFVGVDINGGVVEATGSGVVSVTGKGGTVGDSAFGVYVRGGGRIVGGTAGTVTVSGTGGSAATAFQHGVDVRDPGSTIRSNGANVQVIGQGGANASPFAIGVQAFNGGVITSGGVSSTVTVVGTGLQGAGVSVSTASAQITSGGGAVSVAGTTSAANGPGITIDAGAAITTAINGGNITLIADKMGLQSTVSANAAGTVLLRQNTNGLLINLGAADSATTLGLTDAELDQVTAGTVQIGDANSGAITASAAITHPNNLSLTTGSGVTFNQAVTMAVNKNLTVSAAGTGNGTINLANTNADLGASGTGAISLTTARNIALVSGASVVTVNGNLTLSANAAGTTTGSFVGVDINSALVEVTGTGTLSVTGRSGDTGGYGVAVSGAGSILRGGTAGAPAMTVTGTSNITGSGNENFGVLVAGGGLLTSSGADVSVTGIASGTTSGATGVRVIDAGSTLKAGGAGNVTVTGTVSGAGAFAGVYAVFSGVITSSGGNVLITGSNTGTGSWKLGVSPEAGGGFASGGTGTLTLDGTSTNGADGVAVLSNITAGGDLIITGTSGVAGGGIRYSGGTTTSTNGYILLIADGMNLAGGTINGTTVTLRQKTNGQLINLGSTVDTTASTLELSDAELDRVTAGSVNIGDPNSSGALTVSAAITRPSSTDVALYSGGNIVFNPGTLNTGGAPLLLGAAFSSIQPITSGTDVTTDVNFNTGALIMPANTNLALAINGTTVDTGYNQLNVAGRVNLAGVDLILSGAYVPQPGDSFTLVNNDGTDPITGRFDSLSYLEGSTFTFNGVPMKITYMGGTGNDVVISARTALENWRQLYFGSIANSGNGANLNDYKKDGAVNLLKYAFGLNPTLSNGTQLPRPQKVGGNFVATFTQPAGVSGITYGAEWSTTLQAGSWTPIPDTGSGSTHTSSIAIGTVPKLFMRLTVTDPNP